MDADGQVVREVAGKHTSVHVREQVAERGVQLGSGNVRELRPLRLEMRQQFVVARGSRRELVEVIGAHSLEPVESRGVPRGDARDGRGRDHPLG